MEVCHKGSHILGMPVSSKMRRAKDLMTVNSRHAMKIAFIVDDFPALSQTFIFDQVKGLLDRGHDIHVFGRTSPEMADTFFNIDEHGLKDRVHYLCTVPGTSFSSTETLLKSIRSFGLGKTFFALMKSVCVDPGLVIKQLCFSRREIIRLMSNFVKLMSYFAGRDFDVVHCHFGPLGISGVLLKETGVTNGKVVVSFRGHDLSAKCFERYGKYAMVFKKSDLILPVCDYFKQILIDNGCDPAKTVVHRSGTDLHRFTPKKEVQNKKTGFDILSVGRLVPKKGIEYSVKAIAKLIESDIEEEIRYTIIGDGESMTDLESLVKECGISDHVKFLGWRTPDEISAIMRQADILISSNVSGVGQGYDGVPAVIREAMACALPVISTRTGGISEVVIESKTGFLVPERDEDLLADRIRYLLQNPAAREKMGKEARDYIEREYDVDKLNDRLVEVYKGMIGRVK